MSHTISAIIVNYNASALLRNCVDSLLNSPLDIEIIVVDNASSDSSLDGLSALPQIRIIRNTRNLGFATACNIGVQRATAPYLLFVNPDCYFQPDTMATLLAEHAIPQPPQLVTLSGASHPSASERLQSRKPGRQLPLHFAPEQKADWFRSAQSFPQAPQLMGSIQGSLSQPLARLSPSQS